MAPTIQEKKNRRNQLAKERRARIKDANKPPPPFRPTNTGFSASPNVWETILSNEPVYCRILAEWKWIWTLSQVSMAFANALRPLRTRIMAIMCTRDAKHTIWKAKANELFGLSKPELSGILYEIVTPKFKKWCEVHLMARADVLTAAQARNGPTFEQINAAFLQRQGKSRAR